MLDITETFEQLVAASRSGNFLTCFRDSAFANLTVQRHPLGFRVARLMSTGAYSLRLHIWPISSQSAQLGFEIHDHTFEVRSHALFGELRQTIYSVVGSSQPEYSLYDVSYDQGGSILIRSRKRVTALVSGRSVIQAGDTYELRAGIFHRLDVAVPACAATLVLTTQVGGLPRSLGPLDGPDIIRFERSSYAGTVMDELMRSRGDAADG
jgi:hypothetical protein